MRPSSQSHPDVVETPRSRPSEALHSGVSALAKLAQGIRDLQNRVSCLGSSRVRLGSTRKRALKIQVWLKGDAIGSTFNGELELGDSELVWSS